MPGERCSKCEALNAKDAEQCAMCGENLMGQPEQDGEGRRLGGGVRVRGWERRAEHPRGNPGAALRAILPFRTLRSFRTEGQAALRVA